MIALSYISQSIKKAGDRLLAKTCIRFRRLRIENLITPESSGYEGEAT